MEDEGFSTKVALVTGASRGIGAAIARRLAESDAIVFIADIDAILGAKVASAIGGEFIRLDVSRPEDWAAAREAIEASHGRLDILVNNAGIDPIKSVEDTDEATWRHVMAINLDGAYWGCRAMLPLLRIAGAQRRAGSSVVNISSIFGNAAIPHQAAYGTSKAGVRQLSKLLAVEWGEAGFNIRVNSVHPGTIRTALFDRTVTDWAKLTTPEGTLDAGVALLSQRNPIGRLGSVDDIAYGVRYLCSDHAAFVTGSEIHIDGGYLAK
jgi:NAD(P)-dependent dehydrogenase (short-subunit alcohol dehydrogenase family)